MRIQPIILKGQTQVDHAIRTIKSLPPVPVMEVTIKEFKDYKSVAQLRTVHGWFREVRDALQESGSMFTFASVKYYFKDMFGLMITHQTPSGIRTEHKSLADYKMPEMCAFMDKCYHHAVNDLKVFVTLPGFDD